MEYTVNADGSIMVNSVIMPVSDGEIIPRVGYRMELPEGFERMRWYGVAHGKTTQTARTPLQ